MAFLHLAALTYQYNCAKKVDYSQILGKSGEDQSVPQNTPPQNPITLFHFLPRLPHTFYLQASNNTRLIKNRQRRLEHKTLHLIFQNLMRLTPLVIVVHIRFVGELKARDKGVAFAASILMGGTGLK